MTWALVLQVVTALAGLVGGYLKLRSNQVKKARLDALKDVRNAVQKAHDTNDTSSVEDLFNK